MRLLLLGFLILTGCSSAPENSDSDDMAMIEPQSVTCKGHPSNCDYEILQECPPPKRFEIIGEPTHIAFSSEFAYKVKYVCKPAAGTN